MRPINYPSIFFVAAAVMLSGHCAWAEENGSGAYPPGSIASGIDSMLPAPGWIIRPNYYNFSGENAIDCLAATCTDRAKVRANVNALSLTLGWRPDIDLGSRYAYMVSISVPYVFVDVTTTVTSNSTGASTQLSDSNQGLGDAELIPINLSYHVDDMNDLNFKLVGRAPTGEFDKNQLANLGKNYWSIEPTISYLYNDNKAGLQGAIYVGVNFNETNPDTDFHSGSQAHVEYTLQKIFAYGGDQIGGGLTGYTDRQISDDSGSGVVFPNQRSRLSGIGPVISYTGNLFGQFAVAELKWVHDYEIENRFGGDTLILKAGLIF